MYNTVNLNSARTGAFASCPFGHELQDAFYDDFARYDVIDATEWLPIGSHSHGLLSTTENWFIVRGEQLRPRW